MENKVKFTIKPGGQVKLEVMDGQGESCVNVTSELEVSLASRANQQEEGKKPEFFDNAAHDTLFNEFGR